MSQRRPVAIVVAALIAAAPEASTAVKTLCDKGEQTVWSCTAESRTYSICLLPGRVPEMGFLQYRVGSPANAEFVFPSDRRPAADVFRYRLLNRTAAFQFESDGHQYSIYESINGEGTIETEKEGERVTRIECDESTDTLTLTSTMVQFKAIGIHD